MTVLPSSLKLNMVTLKDFVHLLKSNNKFIQHNKQHHMKTLPSGFHLNNCASELCP